MMTFVIMRNRNERSIISDRLVGRPIYRVLSFRFMVSALCLLGFMLGGMLAGSAVRAYGSELSKCPNEVLRAESNSTHLPECRAYELVSPVAKNGWTVDTVSAVSSHVLVSTAGSFAGGDQRSTDNFFDVERTFDGWVTSPLVVPTSLVSTAIINLLAVSADLSTGLFEYRFASGLSIDERNFYVQQLPDGSPVEVGPAFSEAALKSSLAGSTREVSRPASMSLGHVLFAIGGRSQLAPGVNDLWPGDSTAAAGSQLGFGSLYEYTGVENKAPPRLVGVRNSGPLNSNEEAQLISQCGTSLGFPRRGVFNLPNFPLGETYNAVSGLGSFSRVFFTAAAANNGPSGNACNASGEGSGPPVDELYVRVDASETVPVSEPSLSVPGRACSEHSVCREDENQENGHKRSAGFFQGASKDGSRVFFLTDQPLVNGDKDGARDLYMAEIGDVEGHQGVTRLIQVSHDPNSGEAAEVQGVSRVSEDGSHVYFVARGVLTAKANSVGNAAQSGADNLYVFNTETGHLAFIGDLCSDARASGAIVESRCPANLNSEPPVNVGLNDLGVWQQEDRRPFDVTPDGRFAVFTGYADLTPGDTSTVAQVFEYDAGTERLMRVSVGENGFNKDGNTSTYGAGIVAPSYDVSQNPTPQLTSVSDDGSTVVFQSSDALTSQAVEGYPNVYEYRAGQVYLISDGQDRTISLGGPTTSLVGMDGSGRDIFFTSADQLVPLDGDTQEDVYDARVEGGFSPPAARPGCEGGGCQGAFAPSPSFSVPDSASQLSGEDVETSPTPSAAAAKTKVKPRKTTRCTRGKKLSHGKCVKARHGSKRGTRARKDSGGQGARYR
jgi:hypothetical protein